MGGIQEVDSADQIGQLEALHFKMKPKNSNSQVRKVGGILGNGMARMRKKFRTEKHTSSVGARLGKMKSDRSGNMGLLRGVPFSEIQEWGL